MNAGPLSSIRVIDLSSVGPASRATGILAGYGADVLKVGRPDRLADEAIEAPDGLYGGRPPLTVRLDLATDAGRDELLRLVDRADVLVESYRPGVAAKLGIDAATLRARNPRLVYCSTSGYGRTGPAASWAGHDLNYVAMSGLLSVVEPRADGGPPVLGSTLADAAGGGMHAVIAIVVALLDRAHTGVGTDLDVSATDGSIWLMSVLLAHHADRTSRGTTQAAGPMDLLRGEYACYQNYRARDGRWLSVAAIEGRFWRNLCELLGAPELAAGQLAPEQQDEMRTHLAGIFATRDRDDWVALLAPAGTCVAPVNDLGEVMTHPQFTGRGLISDGASGPELGRLLAGMVTPEPDSPGDRRHGWGLDAEAPSGTATPTGGPLSGYRVLDLSSAAAGPLAATILADQGADVIKIESPAGDFMRTVGTMRAGVSAVFAGLNRNKRSVVLDLHRPEALAQFYELVRSADVVLHNMRPGVAERLGVGYDRLREIREDLVYVAINGWGLRGPAVNHPAYDSIVQAATGFARHQGGAADAPPTFIKNVVCDKSTGISTAQLTTAALLQRERTGQGQRVDVSMLEVGLAFLWPDGMQAAAFVDGPDADAAAATAPPVHRTSDGWIAVAAMLDKEFQALCRVLGREDVTLDERFATRGPRSRNTAELWEVLDPEIALRTTDMLVTSLQADGVPCVPIRPLTSIHDDPQVIANDVIVTIDDPAAGPMRAVRPIGSFSAAVLRRPTHAPRLGEHTDAVLAELGSDLAMVRS